MADTTNWEYMYADLRNAVSNMNPHEKAFHKSLSKRLGKRLTIKDLDRLDQIWNKYVNTGVK